MYQKIQVNVDAKIQVKKNAYDKIAKIMAKVAKYDPCYNFRVEFKGSTYEGLKIDKPDEFDFYIGKRQLGRQNFSSGR